MKKVWAGIAILAFAAAASADTSIYDTITGVSSVTYTTQAGNNLTADNFLVASPGAGNIWQIDSLSWLFVVTTPGSYSVPVTVNVYNGVGVSATTTDPALTDLAGTVSTTVTFNNTGTGAAVGQVSLTGLSINLAAAPDNAGAGYAVQFNYGTSNVAGGIMTATYAQVASATAGSSWSNGFFSDLNVDGTLQNNEFVNFSGWSNGNMNMSIGANATPVPEPASMAVLGIGALALIRRRRSKKA